MSTKDAEEALQEALMAYKLACTQRWILTERERDAVSESVKALHDENNHLVRQRDAALEEAKACRENVFLWKDSAAQWEKTAEELRVQLSEAEKREPTDWRLHNFPVDIAYLKAQVDEQAARIVKLEERVTGLAERLIERVATLERKDAEKG